MKILLVEDDRTLVAALKPGLEKAGFAVDVMYDGLSAQKRLEIHAPGYDIVVLDVGLPDMTGFELCKKLRARKIAIPILMLTGRTAVEDKVQALNLGADDYLTKPFSTAELVARINAVLRRPAIAPVATLQLGDIVVDLSRRLVIRNGKEITLTLKEFGVLEYFMRHPNQIIIRDDILDHVWDFDFSSLSNIVDVHINKIRGKLGLKKGEYLETVRGIGYRLKV